jgi:hypothetical protein
MPSKLSMIGVQSRLAVITEIWVGVAVAVGNGVDVALGAGVGVIEGAEVGSAVSTNGAFVEVSGSGDAVTVGAQPHNKIVVIERSRVFT